MITTHTFRTGAYALACQRAGTGSRRVVLLHAGVSAPAQWMPLMQHAPAAPWLQWHAPALLGHAGSGRLDGATATIDDELDALSRFIDAVSPGEPVDLVGHSWGGALALWLAQRRPLDVRTLTLFEPAVFDLLAGHAPAAFEAIAAFAATQAALVGRGDLEAAAAAFVTYWSGPEAWAAMAPARQAQVCAAMPAMAMAWSQVHQRRTAPPRLAGFGTRVRLLSGARTAPAARAVVQVLRRLLPQATHHELAQAGHMGPVTHPMEVATIVLEALQPLPAEAEAAA